MTPGEVEAQEAWLRITPLGIGEARTLACEIPKPLIALASPETASLYCVVSAKVQYPEHTGEKVWEMGLLHSNPELEPGEGR